MTNYNDDKWHGWNGGECPVHPASLIDVVYADGNKFSGEPAYLVAWGKPLLFRVAKEYKEPRTWWIEPNDGEVFDFPVEGYIKVQEVM